MVGARLVSNGLDIMLVSFLLLSNVSELSIGAKTKKKW